MQNKIKKAFTSAVVASTILWSVGLSAIPFAAKAAPASGTLVKASTPAVYYVGADMKRYVFPNEKTFKTWFADFSGVQIITDQELAALPIGGNVTYKPGIRMVKITTDPKTYAVDANGTLRWITSEAAATALYGADWNQKIDDVADSFFVNYTVGSSISSSADFSPSAASSAATSINVDKGLGQAADGSLTAMLSASQPMGGTLPGGATGVNMAKVDVHNGSTTDVTLYSMSVRRIGVGAAADFSYVYAYEGNNRLTTGRTINSSTNEAVFGGMNVTIPAGGTKTLWVAADMATGTAGNQNGIEITEITTSTGTMVSGLPVSGPMFTIAGAAVGEITITKNGTFVDAKAGSNTKMAEFQLAASSAEDVMINKIALYYTGSVTRENLSNFTLMQAGQTIATTDMISSKDLVTFVLATPFSLEKGSARIFQVYGDVSGSARASEYIAFHLDNDSDLFATGATYGYGVTIDRGDAVGDTGTFDGSGSNFTTTPLTCGNTSCLSVDAGQLNIAFNGPSAKNVAVDAKDIEIFNFTMTAQSNVEVRNVRVQLVAGNAVGGGAGADGLIDESVTPKVANYSDIKLVDTATGAAWGGPLDLSITGSDTSQPVVFNSVFNLSAGESRTFKVTVDVANNAALAAVTADTLTATLNAFVAGDLRNLDNNTNVSDIVPATAIPGNAVTVTASALTASKASTPVAQTYIKGSKGVELGGLILTAGDAGDMKVAAVTMTATGGTLTDYAVGIQTASLWMGSTMVGELVSPDSTTGKLVFNNLNLTVPAGQNVTLVLKGDISSVAAARAYQYTVNAAADLTVTDVEGATKTALGSYPVAFNTMTVQAAGTVSVERAPSDDDTKDGLIVAGSNNVVLAKYKFTARYEEMKATKLSFKVNTAGAASGLSLWDGAELLDTATIDGSGNAHFTSLEFMIPKDGSKTLTVKANLAGVGSSSIATGADMTVTLMDTAGAYSFEVRGASAGSNTVISSMGANHVGFTKISRATKPTVSVLEAPVALAAGLKKAMTFRIAADAAGNVAVKGMSFKVVPSFGTAASVTLTKDAASSVRILNDSTNIPGNAQLVDASNGVCTHADAYCVLNVFFTDEVGIDAGTAKTFEVMINVTATGLTTGDAILTTLMTDSALVTGELDNASVASPLVGIEDLDSSPTSPALAAYNFVWSDMAGDTTNLHNDSIDTATGDDSAVSASNDWTNGLYVEIPSTEGEIIK